MFGIVWQSVGRVLQKLVGSGLQESLRENSFSRKGPGHLATTAAATRKCFCRDYYTSISGLSTLITTHRWKWSLPKPNGWRVRSDSENILLIHIQPISDVGPSHPGLLTWRRLTKNEHRRLNKYFIIYQMSVTKVGPTHEEERAIYYLPQTSQYFFST